MLKTIYKYPIEREDIVYLVYLPLNANIISAKIIRNTLCIYAMVDPTETATKRHKVFVFGTGQPISEEWQEQMKNMEFLDTIVEPDDVFGELVWHVWIEK